MIVTAFVSADGKTLVVRVCDPAGHATWLTPNQAAQLMADLRSAMKHPLPAADAPTQS